MKLLFTRKHVLLFVVLGFPFPSCSQDEKKTIDYVDPFICTQGDHGHWHPSALVPFGLVKLGPDTYPGSLTADGDYAHSGYDYSDSAVRGFSHFHKGSSGGTRILDRAGLLSIMPFVGDKTDSFFQLPLAGIDKKAEIAKPGFYSVQMVEESIRVELMADAHTGVHKYTFKAGDEAHLLLHEGNRDRSFGLTCHLENRHCIEGVQNTSWGTLYFTMHFNAPILETKIWNAKVLRDGKNIDDQEDGGFVCNFGNLKGEPLLVKVGVSLTGIEAARNNLQHECPDWQVDNIRSKATRLWNDKLSLIEVEGDEEYKTIFYTALYHTCFLPVTITNVDGTYPGLDQKVHQANGYIHYKNYAFWDSFRTKYPLYSLFVPGIYRDIVKSLRDIYEQADNYDPYPEYNHQTHGPSIKAKGKDGYQVFDICRHEHMLMVMTDAYFKKIYDIDVKSVYPYLRKEALIAMPERYDKIGYITGRPDETGEFSWDSWCIAQIAKDIGNQKDYEYFMERSNYWKNTWDPSLKFFRARAADGSWLDFPENLLINREKYMYEGTVWHWRWNVLHDVDGLIDFMGGKNNFTKELNFFFENSLYTAGNQPDIHAPYLFNFSGSPWLTQKWVHAILSEPMLQLYGTHDFFEKPILDRIYKATPDGYLEEMDDDYGCMSAWYTLSSMGLYQVCPGNPVYQLTTPLFSKVTLRLNNKIYPGNSFIIKTNSLSEDNIFIQSATLNGEPLNRAWITHEEIVNGGELIYEMGSEPNKKWGVSSANK